MRLVSLVLFHLMPLIYFYTYDVNWLYYGLGIFLPLTIITVIYSFGELVAKSAEQTPEKKILGIISYVNLFVGIFFLFKEEYMMVANVVGYLFLNALILFAISFFFVWKTKKKH